MGQPLLATATLLALGAPLARAATPAILPLDALPGSGAPSARAMAADGTIVGGSAAGGHATAWLPGPGGYTPQRLPLTAGWDDNFANAVNAGGTIAGYQVDADGNSTATVWQRPVASATYSATVLPTPAGAVAASAYAINVHGQVAGFGVTATGGTFGVVWQPGPGGTYAAQPLATPAGVDANSAVATAINDHGVIAGYGAAPDAPYVPAVWEKGRGQSVVVVRGGVAAAINNNGVGAGVDMSAGSDLLPMVIAPYEGEYYGAALPMSALAGDGAANHVNDNDVLVGYAVASDDGVDGPTAALWNPTDTYWDYLNLHDWFRRRDPAARWTLRDANFITDSNLVVGDGLYDPDGPFGLPAYARSFVLDVSSVAAPEPLTLTWAAVLLPAVMTRPRRRPRHDL